VTNNGLRPIRVALATIASVAAAGALMLGSATPAAAATHHVTMTGFPTNPQFCVEGNCSNHTLTLAAGDTVTWTYSDAGCDATLVCPGHSASSTGGSGSFQSSPTMFGPRLMNPSGPTTYSVTFGGTGTYNYTCAYHGSGPSAGVYHMDGAIVVTGVSSQAVGPGSGGSSGPGGSNSANGFFSNGTSTTVSSDQLPNTFVPGLPNSGGISSHPKINQSSGPSVPSAWLLPALAMVVAMATGAVVLTLRKLRPTR
jgi:plastocyanin